MTLIPQIFPPENNTYNEVETSGKINEIRKPTK